jgi:hypothetical protein
MIMCRSPRTADLWNRNNRAYWEGSAGLWYGRRVLLLPYEHIPGTDRPNTPTRRTRGNRGRATLVLSFASKSLREICEDEKHATRQLTKKVTRSLRHRLADLEAAGSVRDLIAGNPRKRKSSGNYQVTLADSFCLEFAANHVKKPLDKNEEVDWKRVNRIQIVRIGKCHE